MGKFETDTVAAVRPQETFVLDEGGIAGHLLRTSRWDRTSRGWYVPGGTPRSPAQRIVSAAALLPENALLGGWAAAHAQGVDLLDGLDARGHERAVDVLLPPGLHRHDVVGIHYRKARVARHEREWVGDLPVTSLVRTALDLACWAPSLVEATVQVDLLVASGLSLAELRSSLPRRRRGCVQAREAIDLAARGVRSPGETRLRLLYVRDVGGNPPLVNPTLTDRAGTFVAMPDLFDEEAGLALEYDGASWDAERELGHRDRRQHREDNIREEAMERLGIVVVRADAEDVGRHRRQTAYRLQRARMDGLGRDRRRDRWIVQREG